MSGANICYQVNKGRSIPGNVVGEHQIFFFQFDVGNNLFLPTPPVGLENRLPLIDLKNNYQVGAPSFSAVAQFHLEYDLTCHEAETQYFFGKGIGIVQRENIDSTEVWNLIRYNIVQ
jgi:hypothetical protein